MVYSPNIASQRVLEKNGFAHEGRQRNAIYKDGNIWDACLFGKLKEEQ
jgi:ribosomal-protein-alanine N-acetyltransferase